MTYPTLEAVGTQRIIDVTALDRPAVFICYAEATQNDAMPVEEAVRAKYAASDVLVAHVIDLHSVPSLFRGVARNILGSEYEKAVAALPSGETPEDYVVILPDWEGAFVKALSLSDVSKQLGAAVFAKDGTMLGTVEGEAAASEAVSLLESGAV